MLAPYGQTHKNLVLIAAGSSNASDKSAHPHSLYFSHTVKPVLSGHSKRRQKLVFKTDYGLMQVKSIAECSKGEHSAILLTFIKLPFAIKTFVLSILEQPLKTGFTVPGL